MRSMPNMTVVAPGDGVETAKAVCAAAAYDGPVYLRLTRDPSPVVFGDDYDFLIGRAVTVREGTDVTVITTGFMVGARVEAAAAMAAEGLSLHVLHVPTVKPLDVAAIVAAAERTGLVVTAEEHTILGGLGGAVAEVLGEHRPTLMRRVGIDDVFGESAPERRTAREVRTDRRPHRRGRGGCSSDAAGTQRRQRRMSMELPDHRPARPLVRGHAGRPHEEGDLGGRRRADRRQARGLRHPVAVRVGQAGQLHPDHDPRAGRGAAAQERHRADPGRLHREPRPPHGQRHGHLLRQPSLRGGAPASTKHNGRRIAIALPPLMYGGHPYHHIGMPGTVMLREEVVEETLIDVMLGLWNDGFRKQIIVNNHGHLWMLETALQKFLKRYQLPGIFRVIDWHRAVREFFRTTEQGGQWDTPFVHADEAETSLGLLLFPEMVDMEHAVETETKQYLPAGHFDNSVDGYHRPQRWSEGEGHFAIEFFGTPEGVVGKPTTAEAGRPSGRWRRSAVPHHGVRRDPRGFPARARCRRSRRPRSAPPRTWSRSCASR